MSNRAAEGGTILDVLSGVHECTFGQTDTARGHDGAHGVQAQHGQPESTHRANDVLRSELHVVKDHFTGVNTLDAHFAIHAWT